jgi:hypothetical protein
MRPSEQNNIATDIVTDIERYRSLLLLMKEKGDLDFYNKSKISFNSYNKIFERFRRDNE